MLNSSIRYIDYRSGYQLPVLHFYLNKRTQLRPFFVTLLKTVDPTLFKERKVVTGWAGEEGEGRCSSTLKRYNISLVYSFSTVC